ncbi:MAG: hypothetical protein ACNA8L_10745 [Luteolibacter sp.]
MKEPLGRTGGRGNGGWVVIGGVGAVDTFTKNGGTGIRARRIGSAP